MNRETEDQIREHAQAIIDLLPPVGDVVPVKTPEELDSILAVSEPGDVIVLSTELVYPKRLVLTKSVILESETFEANEGKRVTLSEPCPSFSLGIDAQVDSHGLFGLELRGTDNIGVLGGHGSIWSRCRLLGDPVKGAHRGIQVTGGDWTIEHCYMDDIFRKDQDCQAICIWDCDPKGMINDCYLSAAGQSIMFGGADSSSEEKIPKDIVIQDCDLTKKVEWLGVQQVKCALEFKVGINIKVVGCRFAYAGTSQGQGAYLIVATVRNQNGKAPWSCIKNIEISNCIGEFASGICNFLGTDNNYPSGKLDGFVIRDSSFNNMDGTLGSGRLFMWDRSPAHTTLQNLVINGTAISALGYFNGMPSPTNLIMGGMSVPSSKYGWKIDGGTGMGGSGHDALMRYMPDAQLDSTIV